MHRMIFYYWFAKEVLSNTVFFHHCLTEIIMYSTLKNTYKKLYCIRKNYHTDISKELNWKFLKG